MLSTVPAMQSAIRQTASHNRLPAAATRREELCQQRSTLLQSRYPFRRIRDLEENGHSLPEDRTASVLPSRKPLPARAPSSIWLVAAPRGWHELRSTSKAPR